ncbi:MAG: hypothetical protein WAM60_10600 [Candidatus Promineifilaceae bacterium]
MASSNQRGGCAVSLFNILAVMFVVATFITLVFVIFLVVVPDNPVVEALGLNTSSEPEPTRVQVAIVPTLTATNIPGIVLPATSTPIPSQNTATPPPINTLRPTLTPSITPTFPPPTPTRTPTPTPTATASPGPSPTATNTRSPFPFTKDLVSPQYLQNYANNAGCNWLGIAGVVQDVAGNPVAGGTYKVHVWDSGIDERVAVGGAPAYGPSGYEQYLFDSPRVQDQNIQLETVSGTAVSQVYRVQTRASCNQNLLYFVFVQNN